MNEGFRLLLGLYDQLEQASEDLTSISKDTYAIKSREWEKGIKEARESLTGETILLFIGGFSAGKSTFINALLGESILPTASRPCTSVITEVEFTKDGMGHRGIIYFIDKSKREGTFREIKDVVDGNTGEWGRMAAIHHVSLIYDLGSISNSAEIDDFSPLSILWRGKIRLVDSPGFGSPFGLNETVLDEYISRANYTYWFFSANSIGGIEARERLKSIRRKTSVIFPVITKADLLTDDAAREEIIERFVDDMGDLFTVRTPSFVSALRLFEAKKKKAALGKLDLPREEMEKAEKQILEMEMSSGMEQVAVNVFTVTRDDKNDHTRLEAGAKDVHRIGMDIRKAAIKEKEILARQLADKGLSEDESYKGLEAVRDQLFLWAVREARDIAGEFGDRLVEDIVNQIKNTKGPINIGKVNSIIDTLVNNVLKPRIDNCSVIIQDKYATSYLAIVSGIDRPQPPNLNETKELLENSIMAALEAVGQAGPQSLLSGASGAIFVSLGSKVPEIAPAMFSPISSGLGHVFVYAGIGLLILSIIPIIPTWKSAVKAKNHIREQEFRNRLMQWVKNLNIETVISRELANTIKSLFIQITADKDRELRSMKGNRDKAQMVIKDIERMLDQVDRTF